MGSCDIKFPIRLEGLASRHHNFSSYEPGTSQSFVGVRTLPVCLTVVLTNLSTELFPGLIYRMIKPKIVLLIFVSGKIVLTGAKVREEIYTAFEMIYPVLQGQSHVLATLLHGPVRVLTCPRLQKGLKPFPGDRIVLFAEFPLWQSMYHYTTSQHAPRGGYRAVCCSLERTLLPFLPADRWFLHFPWRYGIRLFHLFLRLLPRPSPPKTADGTGAKNGVQGRKQ